MEMKVCRPALSGMVTPAFCSGFGDQSMGRP